MMGDILARAVDPGSGMGTDERAGVCRELAFQCGRRPGEPPAADLCLSALAGGPDAGSVAALCAGLALLAGEPVRRGPVLGAGPFPAGAAVDEALGACAAAYASRVLEANMVFVNGHGWLPGDAAWDGTMAVMRERFRADLDGMGLSAYGHGISWNA